MSDTYLLYKEEACIGNVNVERVGLYCKISCSVPSKERQLMTLWARCGGESVRVGICVPKNGEFYLKTQIPTKRFGHPIDSFFVEEKTAAQQSDGEFYPLDAQQPQCYLAMLHRCCFSVREGVPGVLVRPIACHPSVEGCPHQTPTPDHLSKS